MFRTEIRRVTLRFREPAITSRATMLEKETYLIKIQDSSDSSVFGIGEVPVFRGLSEEDTPEFESVLAKFAENFSLDCVPEISSIRFGIESALADMERRRNPVKENFSYAINGLVWMGDKKTMAERIRKKIDAGFRCVKLKIGGIDFNDELDLLSFIRSKFGKDHLELRVDANGAFTPENALAKLDSLSRFGIHSIEQPVKPGQLAEMASIVRKSPIPVALDEELIGFRSDEAKKSILDTVKPHYIILKPSLCGGFAEAEKWINLATEKGIGWWATSALESNVGLTAISLWLRKFDIRMPQGLGTGELYLNNFDSPLKMEGSRLVYHSEKKFEWSF